MDGIYTYRFYIHLYMELYIVYKIFSTFQSIDSKIWEN